MRQMKKELAKLNPSNPFVLIEKDDRILYLSSDECNADHIKEILKISKKYGRVILINTGGHGWKDGTNPTTASAGDGSIILEDLIDAIKSEANVSINVVSAFTPMIYPPGIDIINSYCWSINSLKDYEVTYPMKKSQ